MEPINDDLQLRKLLREWKVENAPTRLDERVLGARRPWWRASLRVPVPLAVAFAALLLALGVAQFRRRTEPAPQPAGDVFNLVDYRPLDEFQIRIIGSQK